MIRKATILKGSGPVEDDQAIESFKESREALRKYGITTVRSRTDGWEIAIACNHSKLGELLKDTPWHTGYKHVLSRIEGSSKRTAVFADQKKAWAICIPIGKDMFHDDKEFEREVDQF